MLSTEYAIILADSRFCYPDPYHPESLAQTVEIYAYCGLGSRGVQPTTFLIQEWIYQTLYNLMKASARRVQLCVQVECRETKEVHCQQFAGWPTTSQRFVSLSTT